MRSSVMTTRPYRLPVRRIPQTGSGPTFDQFLRESKILSSIGGAIGGIGGAFLGGGPIGAAIGGSLLSYGIAQTGYGKKKRKGKKPGPKPKKKRKTKRK